MDAIIKQKNYRESETNCNTQPNFSQMFPRTAKASNHSGNDFRRARKSQTIRKTTFAMRGYRLSRKEMGKFP